MYMNTYHLKISEETANYLQRLQFEVESRHAVIDRIITNHKEDTDASVLESVPFKRYHKQLEESEIAYALAKDEMTKKLIPMVQEKENNQDVTFDWRIEDFSACEVIITIRDQDGCNCCK